MEPVKCLKKDCQFPITFNDTAAAPLVHSKHRIMITKTDMTQLF